MSLFDFWESWLLWDSDAVWFGFAFVSQKKLKVGVHLCVQRVAAPAHENGRRKGISAIGRALWLVLLSLSITYKKHRDKHARAV